MNDCGWADVPLAVIGMSCRLPGADDLEGYWELIQRRGCALGLLPASRFDDTLYFDSRKGTPGKSYTRLGGIVAERPFNRVAYPLSDEQISGSDPVHLAFLEVAGEALRHAGIEPFEIPLRNTGVYIGNARGSLRSANLACAMHAQPVAAKLMESDAFRQLDPQLQAEIVQATAERICAANREDGGGRTNLESNRVAGLVSEAFGLSGPATAVDAACASSLVALAQAVRALQHGAIDMAIVGSASYSAWTSLVIFSQAQALSSVGSFPFDARADGFVSSDGYAAVIVKTLTRALADGDRVWGVVRGIGLSSDGRGKSLWAPRREGQVLAIRRALAGGIDVSSLGYVEAHGTSTQVGDATEIAALNDGLGPLLTKAKPVPLASVKGNIGHTRETAGLAGLIKTLLAMHHGRIPPAAGFEQPNPEIPWDALPFYVPTSAQAWDRPKSGAPRRAAVDAFGIGGLNVHVLVDDEPEHGSGRAQMRVPCDVERTPAAARRGDTGCAIAIVGRGAIFPGARNYAEFQDLVSSGRDARMPVPSARWNLDQFPQLAASGSDGSARLWGGFVTGFEYDWRKRRIAPKQIAHGDPLQFMVLDAAEQAMQDAGCPEERLKRSTTAVVIGTGFGGDFSIELGLALRLPDFQRLLGEELTLHGIATPQAAEIGAEFAAAFLRRYVALADETGSYSSSTLASRVAKALDLQGGAFAVDAGGGSSSVALAAAMDMLQSHACDAVLCAGAQRSLDPCMYAAHRARGSLCLGEPQPAFDCDARGIVPGEGCGAVLLKRLEDAEREGDTIHAVIRGIGAAMDAQDRRRAVAAAVRRAWAAAQSPARGVGVIEATGLAIRDIDADEVLGLVAAYGETAGPQPAVVDAIANRIGCTNGASGMASLLKLIAGFEEGAIQGVHSASATRHAIPEFDGVLRLVDQRSALRPVGADSRLLGAVNCLTPTGQAHHVLLERPATPAARHLPQPVLERGRVCAGPDSSRRPRIAFAFPGQGSQYAGMLNTLVQESPAAAAHLQDLNATLSRLRLPTFDRLVGEDSHKLGTDLFETQLSVLLADLLMFRVLESQGIEADVLTGHSYGEYAALVAGGAWELEQAIKMTRARCAAIASCGVQGGMLATGMPADRLQELLQESEWSRRVFLANHNAPDQTIVAGSTEALREFAERLRTAGHASRLLAVPAPFHTPLMAPVRDMLHATASGCSFRPPNRPLLSSVTNRYTTEPEELRNNLVEQQVRPVHYVDLVRRLIADGVDVLIEVGPRQVLTGLHRQIAGDSPVGIIATDDPRRPGIQQLHSVRKLLDSRGCTVATRPTSPRPASDGGGTEAIVHFDATARRRERNRRAGLAEDTAAATSASGETAASAVDADLAGVLVQFVCEQTGYPPEVVSLDAELEADLGIDSIKKAQLLGELRDHFPIRATHALKLDDFPTLRHILNFLSASRSGEPAGVAHAADEGPDDLIARVANGSATAAPPLTTAVSSAPRTVPPVIGVVPDALAILNVQRFRGSPYNIGFQHGRASAEAIRRTLQKYVDLLGQRLFELQPLQSALDQREIYFGADGMDELRGMADAVGIPVEHLASFNLGLSMEFLPGCTQFAVTARANGDAGLIHAVNEDWMLALALPGILKRMAQVRFPDGGIPFLTFSTCGELAGQNGINARGLAVSSTLLLDRLPRDDYTPGRVHPALVKEVLERADGIDAALDIIRRLPRSGAWSMCLSEHAADRLCYVEYDRESVEVRMADDSVESTNHCLIKSARGETPAQSCQRLDRLHELLHGRNGRPSRVTLAEAQAILRDRYDRSLGRVTLHPTKSTIRRPYTQASIVMRPTLGEVWVTADSVPDDVPDQFHLLKLGELFCEEERAEVSPRQPIATDDPGIDDAQSCRAVPDRFMNRFVLRMVDAPLDEHQQRERPSAGRVLLVGDNPTTESLRQLLSGSGAEVVSLPLRGDLDETLQELDQVWEAGPVVTLILAAGRDPDAGCGLDEDVWKQRRARGVMTPYFVCQRWLQHVARTRLSETPRLVAMTALGGDFGLSGGSAAVEGGALTGLLKGLGQEFDQLCVKIIDAPSGDPPALVARCLLQELDSAAPEVEVGYVCGRRRIVQSAPRPLFVIDKPTLPSGTWVITGGGRGVTAIVARELGRRFGLTMQLLGSSPPPDIPNDWRGLTADRRRELRAGIARTARESGGDPAAAWRDVERQIELDASLRAFADAGVDVTYRQCDVTNRSELAQVLAAIRVEAGPIRGVIHGAGVEASCRFDRKTRENVDRTVAVKVDAAFSLATLTRDDPVEFFVGFGSISGRLGGVGQSDYSMSSDLLAKLFCRLRAERPACRAVTLHWPPWGDTGMAMRPESKLALEIGGHAFMPAAEGAAHLGDELAAGANEAEVLLIDWPTTRIGREAPLSPTEAQAYWQRTPAVATAPLLSGIVRLEDRRRLIAEMDLDPQRDPCLVHHQLDGVPILPLVAALEAFAEAVPLLTPGAMVGAFRDVRIHEGLRFLSGANQTARVEARCERGVIVCELQSDFRNRRGFVQAPSRRHVSAEVDLSPGAPAATIALAQTDGKWADMQYEPSGVNAPSMAIRHGPPLRCLKQVRIQDDRLWGRMIAGSGTELCPSPHRTAWKLPSAVLDACLLACSVLTYVREKALHLPSALGLLRFGDPPVNNESCQVAVQLRETIGSRAVYDFTLYGADGRVILDAQGYQATYLTAAATTS